MLQEIRTHPNGLFEYLNQLHSMTQSTKGFSFYGYVAQYGKQFHEFEPLPSFMKLGTPKECFKNAFVRTEETLLYTEGYILCFGMPFLHAWLTNSETGRGIEVTLPEDRINKEVDYIGVVYQWEYVMELTQTTMFPGVLPNAHRFNNSMLEGLPDNALWKGKVI